MKPASASRRRFPRIEWNYRPENQPTTSSATPAAKIPGLYKLSGRIADEFSRDYFAELIAFATITALSVWPVFVSMIAITRMVRGY
jgi:hypothetical protein